MKKRSKSLADLRRKVYAEARDGVSPKPPNARKPPPPPPPPKKK